jgi:ABC-type polysaccharide/polyol phosphate export permease
MPIIYPLEALPTWTHKYILINPLAFIIHFTKESMFNNHFAELSQYAGFVALAVVFFGLSIWIYRKSIKNVAEKV